MASILENQVGKSRYIDVSFYFWASIAYIESEGGLFVNLSKVILKAKSLLFV